MVLIIVAILLPLADVTLHNEWQFKRATILLPSPIRLNYPREMMDIPQP